MVIDWPPRELHQNTRTDRRYTTAIRQKYKSDCYYLALNNKPSFEGNLHLMITFHPPDKRRRDLDGMLGAIKYGLDGIAAAWGVDDSCFRPITIDVGAPIKGGRVLIERKNDE